MAALPFRFRLPRLLRGEPFAILKALQAYDGDKAKAAQALGISLATLYRRLKQACV